MFSALRFIVFNLDSCAMFIASLLSTRGSYSADAKFGLQFVSANSSCACHVRATCASCASLFECRCVSCNSICFIYYVLFWAAWPALEAWLEEQTFTWFDAFQSFASRRRRKSVLCPGPSGPKRRMKRKTQLRRVRARSSCKTSPATARRRRRSGFRTRRCKARRCLTLLTPSKC